MKNNKLCLIIYNILILILIINFVSASRLPTVGGDNTTWGTFLNDYLTNLAGPNATELNQTMVNGTNIYGSTINTTHLEDGTITDTDISDTTNLTLGEKITFALGEIIDNLVNGWITITGGLDVSGAIKSSDWTNVSITESQINDLSHFNQTTNDSLNNYILYVNSTNPTDTNTWDTSWVANWTAYNSSWSAGGDGSDATWVANWTAYNTTWGTDTNTNAETECSSAQSLLGNGTCILNWDGYEANTDAESKCTGALYLAGNGTCTAIIAGGYSDAWINETIYNKTDVDDINTSMKNYVDYVNSTNPTDTNTNAETECSSAESYLGNGTCVDVIALSSDTDTFVANYSTFLTHATTTYVDAQNTSQTNYINDVNTSVTNTFNLYTLISTLVERVGNWSLDKSSYYTSSEVDDINTSMKNYVDDTAVGDANWDAVFNSTLLIVDTAINTSMKNYVDAQNTSQTNYINVQNTSVSNALGNRYTKAESDALNTSVTNYIADNNDSVNNYIVDYAATMDSSNTGNFEITGNLTLGEKITFTLGEIIDNLVDGWITITGGLNVTGNITTTDTFCFTADCSAKMYHNGTGIIITS
ncbi:hypothetical protein KAT80_00150 [Candidatus Pacearchaeota archaeon]|nr:hypothetical protein [Candidatus Pacearchaeota archaeon]